MKSTRRPDTPDAAPISGSSLPRPHRTLARRLLLAVTALLVPLVVVTLVGVAMFRSSIGSLSHSGETRSTRRRGSSKPASCWRSRTTSASSTSNRATPPPVGVSFDQSRPRSQPRWALRPARSRRWPSSPRSGRNGRRSSSSSTRRRPSRSTTYTDAALDPFHDDLDDAPLDARRPQRAPQRRGRRRDRHHAPERTAAARRRFGRRSSSASPSASLLARWARRSITARLGLLEGAAVRFGSDDLSHRVDVGGDDELGRVGDAFNTMAVQLKRTRDDLATPGPPRSVDGPAEPRAVHGPNRPREEPRTASRRAVLGAVPRPGRLQVRQRLLRSPRWRRAAADRRDADGRMPANRGHARPPRRRRVRRAPRGDRRRSRGRGRGPPRARSRRHAVHRTRPVDRRERRHHHRRIP